MDDINTIEPALKDNAEYIKLGDDDRNESNIEDVYINPRDIEQAEGYERVAIDSIVLNPVNLDDDLIYGNYGFNEQTSKA